MDARRASLDFRLWTFWNVDSRVPRFISRTSLGAFRKHAQRICADTHHLAPTTHPPAIPSLHTHARWRGCTDPTHIPGRAANTDSERVAASVPRVGDCGTRLLSRWLWSFTNSQIRSHVHTYPRPTMDDGRDLRR